MTGEFTTVTSHPASALDAAGHRRLVLPQPAGRRRHPAAPALRLRRRGGPARRSSGSPVRGPSHSSRCWSTSRSSPSSPARPQGDPVYRVLDPIKAFGVREMVAAGGGAGGTRPAPAVGTARRRPGAYRRRRRAGHPLDLPDRLARDRGALGTAVERQRRAASGTACVWRCCSTSGGGSAASPARADCGCSGSSKSSPAPATRSS